MCIRDRVEGVVIGSMRMLRVTTPPADAGPYAVDELSFRF